MANSDDSLTDTLSSISHHNIAHQMNVCSITVAVTITIFSFGSSPPLPGAVSASNTL
ncbi:hypothetical protein DSL72_005043 [Monilinia vaccinii-corymbosi]|uniref:Uncharacterized protein n=1 Tax=Monilinia vaccinii-corymbosi TaxID=61207 RepID=A0A8A3PEH4_9HELO|nr:hypothetical protein DSL72_005043 [Monilinia vaccinii-corymbosi]